jgi:hypothetical protein
MEGREKEREGEEGKGWEPPQNLYAAYAHAPEFQKEIRDKVNLIHMCSCMLQRLSRGL